MLLSEIVNSIIKLLYVQGTIKPKCKANRFYEALHELIDPYAVVSNQFRLQLHTI